MGSARPCVPRIRPWVPRGCSQSRREVGCLTDPERTGQSSGPGILAESDRPQGVVNICEKGEQVEECTACGIGIACRWPVDLVKYGSVAPVEGLSTPGAWVEGAESARVLSGARTVVRSLAAGPVEPSNRSIEVGAMEVEGSRQERQSVRS
ncbi:hypothetical protein CRG98_017843 [Punica granatum]|uniref:Uncharacterized protein n=1 Tax=Punica granatum TaxID=22663 RepID=A0A2I0K145_PUNGR|nr:hypothetical protein CRG98_017843 [Punica granatum]